MTLYEQLVGAGVPLDSHESDLYAKVTPESRALVRASGLCFSVFTSQIDGTAWYDVPFAYDPWWQRRIGRAQP